MRIVSFLNWKKKHNCFSWSVSSLIIKYCKRRVNIDSLRQYIFTCLVQTFIWSTFYGDGFIVTNDLPWRIGCALMSQIFRAQAWEERAQSPESGNVFLFEIGQCLTGDLAEWTVNSLKMNHLISQEWQQIGLKNFIHMFFDARAFKCDTLWVPECFQRLRISRSFFTIFDQKWTCYCKVLEAPTNSKIITFESPFIKEHM
jgi:hypothetical protein